MRVFAETSESFFDGDDGLPLGGSFPAERQPLGEGECGSARREGERHRSSEFAAVEQASPRRRESLSSDGLAESKAGSALPLSFAREAARCKGRRLSLGFAIARPQNPANPSGGAAAAPEALEALASLGAFFYLNDRLNTPGDFAIFWRRRPQLTHSPSPFDAVR